MSRFGFLFTTMAVVTIYTVYTPMHRSDVCAICSAEDCVLGVGFNRVLYESGFRFQGQDVRIREFPKMRGT